MSVATTQHLNYRGQEFKTCAHFAAYISDTPVNLKQCQGHQTYHDNVDSNQGYNRAKFERSCFNGVQVKANVFFFFPNEETCQLSPFNMCKHKKQWYMFIIY